MSFDESLIKAFANLRGADLEVANLRYANLRGADLEGANLQGANLQGANLRGASLRGANLWNANLAGANLRDVNLAGAYLRDVNLQGANLRGAKGILRLGPSSDGYEFFCVLYKGEPWIKAGCRWFSATKAKEHWAETRGGTPLGDERLRFVEFLEKEIKSHESV